MLSTMVDQSHFSVRPAMTKTYSLALCPAWPALCIACETDQRLIRGETRRDSAIPAAPVRCNSAHLCTLSLESSADAPIAAVP